MDKFTPAKEGRGFEFTEILQPLEKYRDHLVVVSNLAHKQAAGIGSDAGADHARSAAVFLSGAHPEKASIHVRLCFRIAGFDKKVTAAKLQRLQVETTLTRDHALRFGDPNGFTIELVGEPRGV